MPKARVTLDLRGLVQGVGMRPWVLRRARELGLGGSVRNVRGGVRVVLQGEPEAIDAWLESLRASPPDGAMVETIETPGTLDATAEATDAPARFAHFEILNSGDEQGEPARCLARIPLDVGLCNDCLGELFDPGSRLHRYAFVHCTACGPRASVTYSLPYDRGRTSLAAFPPCDACASEYADPGHRRFHAQTACCPACGPKLHVLLPASPAPSDPIEAAAAVLTQGGIVALQGFGGFHLIADATSSAAVSQLRKRKHRPGKPLGVLVADLYSARRLIEMSRADEALLKGPARALVVAPRRDVGCQRIGLAPEIAPGISDLGVLLPHTPAQQLLLHAPSCVPGDAPRFDALVMTSANRAGDPTISTGAAAVEQLGEIADLIIGHDRECVRPSDDPVFRSAPDGPIPIRLSRSTAPCSIALPAHLEAPLPILALGGDLKCAPAIAFGREIVLAEHVGDLGSPASADALIERVAGLCRLLSVEPALIAVDAHPDAITASLADQLVGQNPGAAGRRIAVQHHHAHALACLTEHGVAGPALAITLDGVGFGTDGRPWGGELLYLRGSTCQRLAHLETVPLPGGDRAAREPWRMAAMWLERAFSPRSVPVLDWHRRQDPARVRAVAEIAARGVASPETSSCGRLFDAVASLLGLCDTAQHEAEAGTALETLARAAMRPPALLVSDRADAVSARNEGEPDRIVMSDAIRSLVEAQRAGASRSDLALGFHFTLAERLARAALDHAKRLGVREVALSGGCFQNRILLEMLREGLERRGLVPLVHRRVPPNDGGLAVGQSVAAILSFRARDTVSPDIWDALPGEGPTGLTVAR